MLYTHLGDTLKVGIKEGTAFQLKVMVIFSGYFYSNMSILFQDEDGCPIFNTGRLTE